MNKSTSVTNCISTQWEKKSKLHEQLFSSNFHEISCNRIYLVSSRLLALSVFNCFSSSSISSPERVELGTAGGACWLTEHILEKKRTL